MNVVQVNSYSIKKVMLLKMLVVKRHFHLLFTFKLIKRSVMRNVLIIFFVSCVFMITVLRKTVGKKFNLFFMWSYNLNR